MTEAQMLWVWTRGRVQMLKSEDPERGDGILIWVVMTAILAAAAIAITAIIVNKARDTANNTQTQ
jgi:hypothetical protein